MKRKKLLFITYFFPPYPAVASIRTKGIAKYLKDFGWDVTVLTTNDVEQTEAEFDVVKTPYDGSFYTFFSNKFKKYKSNPLSIKSKGNSSNIGFSILSAGKNFVMKTGLFMPFPDEFITWKKYAVEKALDLHKKEKFDAILSSSGPVSINVIAKEIKEQLNMPWIADFRDLWTQNHYYPYNCIKKFFETKLELQTLKDANALVTVSNPLTELFQARYKEVPVYTITNGYNPEEIAPENNILDSTFNIVYTGRFYPGKLDPESLFAAVKELLQENKIDKNKINLDFYGYFGDYLTFLTNKYELNEIVAEKGFLDREVILEKQRKAQLLLSLNWNDPEEKGIITGKLFEYLAAQRPIISVGGYKDTELSKILKETEAGESACSVEEIKTLLLKYYKEYLSKGNVIYQGNYDKIKKYSHHEMACSFSEVLNKLLK